MTDTVSAANLEYNYVDGTPDWVSKRPCGPEGWTYYVHCTDCGVEEIIEHCGEDNLLKTLSEGVRKSWSGSGIHAICAACKGKQEDRTLFHREKPVLTSKVAVRFAFSLISYSDQMLAIRHAASDLPRASHWSVSEWRLEQVHLLLEGQRMAEPVKHWIGVL